MKYLFLSFLMATSLSLQSQSHQLQIKTKNDSDSEKSIIPVLEGLMQEYDLSKWIFTKDIIIEQYAIPHSHPVLTLSTRYGEKQKNGLLSTFIHEQTHWYLETKPESVEKAVAKFRKRYKNVPFKNRAGARDEYSTYMHLIVCYLEYRSMASLIGEEEAKQLMWNQTHYTWIYNKIIEDSQFIGKVLKDHDFNLLD